MSSRKKETFMRRGNFMTQPNEGWLHDDRVLAKGEGVYYTFPVRYLGSIQVLKSLRTLNIDQKTEVCREGIARTAEASKVRKAKKRKAPKYCKEYLADAPYVKVMELKLNVSTEGIATSDMESNEVISNDGISKISFASGGEGPDYFYITYVAKDKRDNRYCHVFDCAKLADDVLATVGQAFTLLQTSGGVLKGAAALAAAPKVEGAQNPMYMRDRDGASADMPNYDAMDGQLYDTADDPANRPLPPPPPAGAGEEIYDDMDRIDNPDELVGFLNSQVQSKHIYGDEDPDAGELYGDGQTGWGYLDVDPEAVYGDLVDM